MFTEARKPHRTKFTVPRSAAQQNPLSSKRNIRLEPCWKSHYLRILGRPQAASQPQARIRTRQFQQWLDMGSTRTWLWCDSVATCGGKLATCGGKTRHLWGNVMSLLNVFAYTQKICFMKETLLPAPDYVDVPSSHFWTSVAPFAFRLYVSAPRTCWRPSQTSGQFLAPRR